MAIHSVKLIGLDNFSPANADSSMGEFGESGSSALLEVGDAFTYDASQGTTYHIDVNEDAGGSNDATMGEGEVDQTLDTAFTVTSTWAEGGTETTSDTDITFDAGTSIFATYKITLSGDDGQTYQFFGVTLDAQSGVPDATYGIVWDGGIEPPDGTVLTVTANVNSGSYAYICFAQDTMIETFDKGPLAIQHIKVGDRIATQSGGSDTVRWIGHRSFSAAELKRNSKLTPVRITAQALGNNLPHRDLLVSRQHRILVTSSITQRLLNAQSVLIPAIKLTELPGIYIDHAVTSITYFHMLFDSHQIIFAEGAETESLFTGPEALKSVSEDARAEILEIFPNLCDGSHQYDPAAYIPSGQEQKQLIACHAKSNQSLCNGQR